MTTCAPASCSWPSLISRPAELCWQLLPCLRRLTVVAPSHAMMLLLLLAPHCRPTALCTASFISFVSLCVHHDVLLGIAAAALAGNNQQERQRESAERGKLAGKNKGS